MNITRAGKKSISTITNQIYQNNPVKNIAVKTCPVKFDNQPVQCCGQRIISQTQSEYSFNGRREQSNESRHFFSGIPSVTFQNTQKRSEMAEKSSTISINNVVDNLLGGEAVEHDTLREVFLFLGQKNLPTYSYQMYCICRKGNHKFSEILTLELFNILIDQGACELAYNVYKDLKKIKEVAVISQNREEIVEKMIASLINSNKYELALKEIEIVEDVIEIKEQMIMKLFNFCLVNNKFQDAEMLYSQINILGSSTCYFYSKVMLDLCKINNITDNIKKYIVGTLEKDTHTQNDLIDMGIEICLQNKEIEKAIKIFSLYFMYIYSVSEKSIEQLISYFVSNDLPNNLKEFINQIYDHKSIVPSSMFSILRHYFENNTNLLNSLVASLSSVELPMNYYEFLYYCSPTTAWEGNMKEFRELLKTKKYEITPQLFVSALHSSIKIQKWEVVLDLLDLYSALPLNSLKPWEETIKHCRKVDKAMIYYNKLNELKIKPSIYIYKMVYQLALASKQTETMKLLIDDWYNKIRDGDSEWNSRVLEFAMETNDSRILDFVLFTKNSERSSERTISLLSYYKSINDIDKIEEILSENIDIEYSITQLTSILETCKHIQNSIFGLEYFNIYRKQQYPLSKNIVSLVFSFYKTSNNWSDAVNFFEERKKSEGINNHLYYSMLSICKQNNNWEYANKLILDLISNNVKPSNSMQNSVLSLFRDLKRYEEAEDLYNKLKENNKLAPVVHGCMISIYGDQNRFEEGFNLYNNLKNEDEIGASTFCALFHNCALKKDVKKAESIYDELLNRNIEHNSHIYSSLMQVYKETEYIGKIEALLSDMRNRKISPDQYVNELLHSVNLQY